MSPGRSTIAVLCSCATLASWPSASRAADRTDTPLVTRTLTNGTEVLVYPDPIVPMVTAELVVRNGAAYETPATSGLAHLYEHLFWPPIEAGSGRLSSLMDRGISFNANTGNEKTNFFLISPAEDLRATLTLLRDSASTLDVTRARFDTEKELVIAEIRRAEANPYAEMNRRVRESLFPGNRTFMSPLGIENVVRRASLRQLQAVHDRAMNAGNFAIVVTGDCEPEIVFGLCEELFGEIPRGVPLDRGDPGPPPPGPVADVIRSELVEDTVVTLGWRGPGVEEDPESTLAADVLSMILRQPNSRFQRALVDTGLVVGIDVVYLTQGGIGLSTVTFRSDPGKAKEALGAVRRELSLLVEPDYFSGQELENARRAVIADEYYDREDLTRYSHTLGYWWASSGTEYLMSRLESTREIGREEITRYVRRYLYGGMRVAVAVTPDGRTGRNSLVERDLLQP